MNALPRPVPSPTIDLTRPRPMAREIDLLKRGPILSDDLQTIRDLSDEESPLRRTPLVAEALRKVETVQAVSLIKGGTRLALENDPAGLRLFFTFLEVKRPGVEVLHQLSPLLSVERVGLKVLRGTWQEAPDSRSAAVTGPLAEALGEAARLGVLAGHAGGLPADVQVLHARLDELRGWFRRQAVKLAGGQSLTDGEMNLITQVCMLEIDLMERRVSRLASRVDPYDSRSIGRLMPVLSFYDQDIEHLKQVVSRLATYRPFYERLLTMEHALSSSEVDRLQKQLLRDPFGLAIGRTLESIRHNPVLDRELAYFTSAAWHLALRRHQALEGTEPPDLVTIVQSIIASLGHDARLTLMIEPEVASEIGPEAESWGFVPVGPATYQVAYREERAGDYVRPDGTPNIPDRPGEKAPPPLSIKELVRRQLSNDAFIVGLLENSRITNLPGIVPMIATQTRSIRVLDKIITSRHLLTGVANKDVPRLILTNPTRVPLLSMKSLINVRYVNRVDLERMARPTSEVRPEIRSEINSYLRLLRS